MQLSSRRRCSCRWADDWQDALARANDTRFGLQAVVFTRDLGWAMAAFERLDVGGVMVNDVPTFRMDPMPYGGTKDSGAGREGVAYAMRELAEEGFVLEGAPASEGLSDPFVVFEDVRFEQRLHGRRVVERVREREQRRGGEAAGLEPIQGVR